MSFRAPSVESNSEASESEYHETNSRSNFPTLDEMEIDTVATAALRHALPPLPYFTGEPGQYRSWRTQLVVKLRIDGPRMGGPIGQIAAILMALKGNAQRLCAARMSKFVEEEHTAPVEDVLFYLDSIFKDPDLERAAQESWFRLRQGTTPFDLFFAEFERLLCEAGGDNFNERIKVGQLQVATSNEIVRLGIAAGHASTLLELGKRYRQISTDLASLKAGPTLYATPLAPRQAALNHTVPMDIDLPETYPATQPTSTLAAHRGRGQNRGRGGGDAATSSVRRTRVNPDGQPGPGLPTDERLRGRTAVWISEEEGTRRRQAGACLRCGRMGCRIAVCPLAAARNPNARTPAARANIAYTEPDLTQYPVVEVNPSNLSSSDNSKN